jgi:hypothetical protein
LEVYDALLRLWYLNERRAREHPIGFICVTRPRSERPANEMSRSYGDLVDAYINKPFEKQLLVRFIERLLAFPRTAPASAATRASA